VSKHALLNKMAKTKFSRSICQTLFETVPSTRNEFFQRGRMAYVVELEEEAQSDVPVTLLRSTFECANDKADQNINANNLLINVSLYPLILIQGFLFRS
jgi:IK cytokine